MQPVKIPDFQTRYFYGGAIGNKGKQRENEINVEIRKRYKKISPQILSFLTQNFSFFLLLKKKDKSFKRIGLEFLILHQKTK